MKIRSRLCAGLAIVAAVGLSALVGPQAASASTPDVTVGSASTVQACGFDFGGQKYKNCGKTNMKINVQYVGGDPAMGFQHMGKSFCVKPGRTVSVLIPGGFWLAEAVIDNGPANGPGKC